MAHTLVPKVFVGSLKCQIGEKTITLVLPVKYYGQINYVVFIFYFKKKVTVALKQGCFPSSSRNDVVLPSYVDILTETMPYSSYGDWN